jgi:hypothetical protein
MAGPGAAGGPGGSGGSGVGGGGSAGRDGGAGGNGNGGGVAGGQGAGQGSGSDGAARSALDALDLTKGPASATVLPGGRGAVCQAVMAWLGAGAAAGAVPAGGAGASRLLLVTGPGGSGKTFTLAWAASELAVLADEVDDERFAWVSARGMTPKVLAWLLAGQLGVTVRQAADLPAAVAGRLRGAMRVPAQGARLSASMTVDLKGGVSGVEGGAAAPRGSGAAADGGANAAAGDLTDPTDSTDSAASAASSLPAIPASRSAAYDVLSDSATFGAGSGWSQVTVLISELDLAGVMRDGAGRAAIVSELIAPLLAVPGVRIITESVVADLPGCGSGQAAVLDLADPRWTDRAEFAAWLDDLVPSGGAAAPQAYPNPRKARETLSLVAVRHAGLGPTTDDRPWKLAAVPFDVAFREGIADQIVLEPANLVLAQQPALSLAVEALGAAVAPGTRAAWRVAGQALTTAASVPERAAVLHGAALAVGDESLAEVVAPYAAGVRPSDGVQIGEPMRWRARWAGWRPLPPDSPRSTPWPGPVAALALVEIGNEKAEKAEKPDEDAAAGAAPQSAGPAANGHAHGIVAAGGAQNSAGSPVGGSPQSAAAAESPATTPPATTPTAIPTLVAVDDLARAYRLDPATGAITGRPTSPVMVKARAMALLDAEPALVFTNAARTLAVLGASAPRETVAAVRDVLPDTAVTAVAVAGDALVFGAADGRVHVWSTVTDELMADPEDQHSGPVTAVSAIWMPDLDVLFALSGGRDGTFRLWAVPADASLLPVEDRGVPVTAVTAAVTEALGPVAAVAWADGIVTLWDLGEARTGKPIPFGWPATALALGPDGLLIVGGADGLIAVDVDLATFFEE